ncbi:hypothetical protein Esti_002448 [Eimeria stiedai]
MPAAHRAEQQRGLEPRFLAQVLFSAFARPRSFSSRHCCASQLRTGGASAAAAVGKEQHQLAATAATEGAGGGNGWMHFSRGPPPEGLIGDQLSSETRADQWPLPGSAALDHTLYVEESRTPTAELQGTGDSSLALMLQSSQRQQQQQLPEKQRKGRPLKFLAVTAALCFSVLFLVLQQRRHSQLAADAAAAASRDTAKTLSDLLHAAERLAVSVGSPEARAYLQLLSELGLQASYPEQQQQEDSALERQAERFVELLPRLLESTYRYSQALAADNWSFLEDADALEKAAGKDLEAFLGSDYRQACIASLKGSEGLVKLQVQRVNLAFGAIQMLRRRQETLSQQLRQRPLLQNPAELLQQQQQLLQQLTERVMRLSVACRRRAHAAAVSEVLRKGAVEALRVHVCSAAEELMLTFDSAKQQLEVYGSLAKAGASVDGGPPDEGLPDVLAEHAVVSFRLSDASSLLHHMHRGAHSLAEVQMLDSQMRRVATEVQAVAQASAPLLEELKARARRGKAVAAPQYQSALSSLGAYFRWLKSQGEAHAAASARLKESMQEHQVESVRGAERSGAPPSGSKQPQRRPLVAQAVLQTLLSVAELTAQEAAVAAAELERLERKLDESDDVEGTVELLKEAAGLCALSMQQHRYTLGARASLDMLLLLEKEMLRSEEALTALVATDEEEPAAFLQRLLHEHQQDLQVDSGATSCGSASPKIKKRDCLLRFVAAKEEVRKARSLTDAAAAAASMSAAALLFEEAEPS